MVPSQLISGQSHVFFIVNYYTNAYYAMKITLFVTAQKFSPNLSPVPQVEEETHAAWSILKNRQHLLQKTK